MQFEFDRVNLKKILETINKRLSYLKDEDHQIGHSYFMNIFDLEGLRETFKKNILPLLKEFFYNDYSKIRLVLGDGFIEPIPIPKFATNDIDIMEEERYTLKIIDGQFDIIKALKATLGKI